jgi:VanZ family protein
MPRVPRKPFVWLLFWIVWSLVLWTLSSGPMPGPPGPEIPFFDKICHFGYFFGGAGLLSAFLFRIRPERPDWGKILAICIFAGLVIGRLDEWHQSWIPYRSGNDIDDFLADMAGTLCGSLVFRRLHRFVN